MTVIDSPALSILMLLLGGGMLPGTVAGKDDSRFVPPSGMLAVCKEYGTVLGTYLTTPRGKEITRLNFLFGEEVDPRFSPTDDRVLFTSPRGGTPGLWTIRRDGEEQKRICDGSQGDWSPDGRRVVFCRQGRILERWLATGEETPLTPADWKSCSRPACAPDGRRILFVTQDGAKQTLWLLVRGEPAPKRLVDGEIPSSPRWAPEGDRVAYQDGAHLWLIDADGGNRRQLTAAGGIQRRPAWSPDGTAIAYNQGPSPRGPWQMCVIRVDGEKSFPISRGDARSVLCSDWGTEESGAKPKPIGSTLRLKPRVQWWQIEHPQASPSTDWAEFCRKRQGWNTLDAGRLPSAGSQGAYAVENRDCVLLLLAGRSRFVLVPKSTQHGAIEFALLDRRAKEAGPLESIRVLRHGPDEAVFESASASTGSPMKATWTFTGNRPLVHVAPVAQVEKLRVGLAMQCVVVPDRFGNDLVLDPQTFDRRRAALPWAPLVVALFGNGSDMLLAACPEPGQRVELREAADGRFPGADLAFQGHRLSVATIACKDAWHVERFGARDSGGVVRFPWRMPCAASWRLAVEGDERRHSTFFTDAESPVFDKQAVVLRNGRDLVGNMRLGLIYLFGRTATTPPETLTPVDLLRDALGMAGSERTWDEAGLTGFRTAASPTTWAELSVTIESIAYLFERQLEVQDHVYARHLCDDLAPLLEGIDQRLKEYADFARQVDAWGETLHYAGPAAKLRELARKQGDLKSSGELLPLVAKIKQLTAKEADANREEFDKCRRAIRRLAEPRVEMLAAYRKLAMEVRDAAGVAPLAQSDRLDTADKVRSLCQGVLRNRLFAENSWRGEDYRVPAFWLGPRPYQDVR